MGDVVVFEGTGSTFPSGNRLVHGEQGVVTGPYSITSVAVKFPSNDGNVSCLVTSLTNQQPEAQPRQASGLQRSARSLSTSLRPEQQDRAYRIKTKERKPLRGIRRTQRYWP